MALLAVFIAVASIFCASAHPASGALRNELSLRKAELPSADAFYSAPHNLSSYSPGAIIRYRRPPSNLALLAAKINYQDAWQILYRSTGALDEPLAAMTTVVIPHDADFSKVLSYQVEIDAPYEGCFPSITLQQSSQYLDSWSAQYGELWAVSALEKGWIVAFPDHEGPRGAFTSGLVEGRTTIDGIRAALRSGPITAVQPNAKVALWGYSGGSLATEWALELQDRYAPELNITAAAIGGVPANLKNALEVSVNKKIGAGFAFSAQLGIANAYPAFDQFLQQNIIADKKNAFYKAGKQCTIPTIVDFAYSDVFSYFKDGSATTENPIFSEILDENTMGYHGVPLVPLYLYHGINDELLPFQDAEALYDKYCAAGANIHFSKEAFGEHILVAITGAAGALKFLADRMDGIPYTTGCSTETVVSSALDPKNYSTLGGIISNVIVTLLGKPLGPAAWLGNAQATGGSRPNNFNR